MVVSYSAGRDEHYMHSRHEVCPGTWQPPAEGSMRGPCATGFVGTCAVCGRTMLHVFVNDNEPAVNRHVDYTRRLVDA